MAEGTDRDLPENRDMSDNGTSQYTPLKAVVLNQLYDQNDTASQSIIWGGNVGEDWNDPDDPWYNSSPEPRATIVDQSQSHSQNQAIYKQDTHNETLYDSQPVCNQALFAMLDEDLRNQPKQVYTEQLLSKTNNCDDTIFVYRAILAKRARLLSNCPKGQLMTRKRTKAGTVAQKYATDCYYLQNFLLNRDPKAVADTFCRKAGTAKSEDASIVDQTFSAVGLTWIRNEFAAMKSELNMLKQDVHTLKVQKQRDDQIIKRLESELAEQRHTAESMNLSLQTEVKRIQSQVVKANAISSDKTSDPVIAREKKPYAEVVSGSRNPSSATDSSQAYHVEADRCDRNPDSEESDNTARIVYNRDKHRYERITPNEKQSPGRIEVRITNSRDNESHVKRSDQSSSDHAEHAKGEQPVFESVHRRRTRRYYVGGIAASSNRTGFMQFLRELGISPAGLRLIRTRNDNLAAKLTVDTRDSYIIEDKNVWPRGVHCRRWYGENEWASWVNSKQVDHRKPYNE